MTPVYPRMTATYGYVWWSVISQLVFGVRRAVYSWKEWKSENKKEKKEGVNSSPHSCLSRHQTFAVSRLCVPSRYDKKDRGRHFTAWMKQHPSGHHRQLSSTVFLPHSEHCDLLLGLGGGVLQLALGLLQLALQSVASCLQVADLRFALLQRQRQLGHLTLNLQLLLLVLQPDLQRGDRKAGGIQGEEGRKEEVIHPPRSRHWHFKLYDCTLICCAGLFCYIWIKSVLFCPELRNYDKVVDQHQWLLEMRFLMRPGNMWILYLQSDNRLYMFLDLGYYYMGMWHKRCLFLVLNASLQSSDVVFWTVLPALMFAFIHLVIISISLIVLFII